MLVRTDFSLFKSALKIEDAVTLSEDIAVLCDNTLFGVLPFVYESRKQDKLPVISVEKVVGGAKYIFIALNKKGYDELLVLETFNHFEKGLKTPSGNLRIIVSEIIDPLKEIIPVEYGILSNNSLSNSLIKDYCKNLIETKVLNGRDIKDKYTVGLFSAIGNKSNMEKEILNIDFNCIAGNFKELKEVLLNDGVSDYFVFGNPNPPKFKFLEKYAKEEGIFHEAINDQELFEHYCKKGLSKRFNGKEIPKEYIDRLDFEINVIKGMKFPGYMLIVWDFVNYAKRVGIPVGPGRGSAAGSLVAYSLEITNIDPMKYDLLFERFLNPDRVSFPDIDMDFCQEGRGKVIDYVIESYGQECVAQVITFGKVGAKSSIRDAARGLQEPEYLADKIAKSIPETPGTTLEGFYKENQDNLEKTFKEDYKVKKIFDGARKITGFTRNLGIHAAGLIIGTDKIYTKAPVYDIKGVSAVGYDGKYLEDVDLVKFDFLGLKTLTTIDLAVKLIKENKGIQIDMNNIDYEDRETFKKISQGETIGMFQIESAGMQDLNKRLKPDTFEDLIAVLALFRPGPMESGMLDSFVNRKNGKENIDYFYPEMKKALEPILKPTYGVIVYQEQVMQIVQTIGGFSLGYADIIRRAMGKKKDMSVYNAEFSEGAEKNGFNKNNASELFKKIEKFAGYGFNKSHSAAYAMVTFQTAWLKTHYPVEFMTALINTETSDIVKMVGYVKEAMRMGIEVKRPCLSTSKSLFTTDGNIINYGLSGVLGVGHGAENIINLYQENKDLSFFELITLIQKDPKKDLELVNKEINKLTRKLLSLKNKGSKLSEKITKYESFEKKLSKAQENALVKATNEIVLIRQEYQSLLESKESLIVKLDSMQAKFDNENKFFEKLNKRVFHNLAAIGAFDIFGYSRKFLIENMDSILSLKFPEKITKEEYSMQELIKFELDFAKIMFVNPFGDKLDGIQIFEETPVVSIVEKTKAYKKDRSEYTKLKFVYPDLRMVEVSDFNNKSDKYQIGDLVVVNIRENGKYKNLQYIKPFNLKDFKSKKPEAKILEINVLEEIPENIESFDIVNVYDSNGVLIMSMN